MVVKLGFGILGPKDIKRGLAYLGLSANVVSKNKLDFVLMWRSALAQSSLGWRGALLQNKKRKICYNLTICELLVEQGRGASHSSNPL